MPGGSVCGQQAFKQENRMRVPPLVCWCLIENKKSMSKKGHNFEGKKMHFELSSLIIWIALWIVNTYSKFQENIFRNDRDITKCQKFCTTPTMTTPQGYSNTSGFL